MELSMAQYDLLEALSKGERPRTVHAITRKWLKRHGFITVERLRNGFKLTITDLGREVIKTAKRGKPGDRGRFIPEKM